MDNKKLSGTIRKNIQPGRTVEIVQKHHQQTDVLTEGVVKRILTNASKHPYGVKVQLETGEIGRVKNVLN